VARSERSGVEVDGGSTTVLGLEEEDGGGLVRGLGRGGGVLQHWG
jgi:hypothetical protein